MKKVLRNKIKLPKMENVIYDVEETIKEIEADRGLTIAKKGIIFLTYNLIEEKIKELND
jgi:hypothetical protein